MEDIFLNGSCFNLFCTLYVLFPEAEAYCNISHVITKIDEKYYDITGEIKDTDGYMLLSDIWTGKYQNDSSYHKEDMYVSSNKAKYTRL